MPYNSQINFTFDTICPWTYLAHRRLSKALASLRARDPPPPITFTLHYHPFVLHSDAPQTGEDKYKWYLTNKYNNSEDAMRKYTTLMTAYGIPEGIHFQLDKGTIAATEQAHRVVQVFQERAGEECAGRIVESLYRQYFEEARHPSSEETLLRACEEAGIGQAEAREVVGDEREGLAEVRGMVREQKGNGVDAVPYVIVEGKRRDFTLEGAKEVEDYVKVLEQVVKESS